jgi:2-keto-4-pentenoate hydratase/2-oxohepta-3-ene-1,7-dioic acid hydratase in catechol pathway
MHDRGEVDGVRLVTFQAGGNVGVGVRRDGVLLDTGYTSMLDLIRDGERGLERAEAASQEVSADRMLAPIPRPPKILCSGVNYASHADENPDAVMPTEPFFFSKLPSAVIGPGEPIVIPTPETKTDYEVELAMVIGREGKRLSEDSALEHVFGWTILHDVSARDVQFKDNQLTLGKGPDTFSPLGPEIVTADELGDWSTLRVSTTVNGETMQDSPTSQMLFSPGRLLEFATGLVTLDAGDVVTTGSPAGVGCFRDPPVYLKPGDEVTVSVDRIGGLTNPVVAGW